MSVNIGAGINVNANFGLGAASTFGSSADNFYNQHFTAVNVNGRLLEGYADGTSVRLNRLGGQITTTEGTDGPGHNMATKQGYIIEVDLREESPDHEYLMDINRAQYDGGGYVSVTVFTGDKRVFTCRALVGAGGNLNTGGAQQGSITYQLATKTLDLY